MYVGSSMKNLRLQHNMPCASAIGAFVLTGLKLSDERLFAMG